MVGIPSLYPSLFFTGLTWKNSCDFHSDWHSWFPSAVATSIVVCATPVVCGPSCGLSLHLYWCLVTCLNPVSHHWHTWVYLPEVSVPCPRVCTTKVRSSILPSLIPSSDLSQACPHRPIVVYRLFSLVRFPRTISQKSFSFKDLNDFIAKKDFCKMIGTGETW